MRMFAYCEIELDMDVVGESERDYIAVGIPLVVGRFETNYGVGGIGVEMEVEVADSTGFSFYIKYAQYSQLTEGPGDLEPDIEPFIGVIESLPPFWVGGLAGLADSAGRANTGGVAENMPDKCRSKTSIDFG